MWCSLCDQRSSHVKNCRVVCLVTWSWACSLVCLVIRSSEISVLLNPHLGFNWCLFLNIFCFSELRSLWSTSSPCELYRTNKINSWCTLFVSYLTAKHIINHKSRLMFAWQYCMRYNTCTYTKYTLSIHKQTRLYNNSWKKKNTLVFKINRHIHDSSQGISACAFYTDFFLSDFEPWT